MTSSLRRSFPIATTFKKFFDLDRCYSISRVPVDNDKELVVFNLHMSAYGNDDQIRQGQIRMLCQDMEKEYQAGNYVLCGGDFNHDLKASEDDTSEHHSWAYPFPRKELPEHLPLVWIFYLSRKKLTCGTLPETRTFHTTRMPAIQLLWMGLFSQIISPWALMRI